MAEQRAQPGDQTVKSYLVLITAVLALVGFVLEIGPVAGVFPSVLTGLEMELPTSGFLPYLALAASAAIGLHLTEDEPTPKEEKPERAEGQPTPEGEMIGTRTRVRPEIHQLRMVVTALGGFALLKGVNLVLLWPSAQAAGINLPLTFRFGLFYMALAWLVMWQFLRWFAQGRKWIRLQDELVGGNVTRVVAPLILIAPLLYVISLLTQRMVLTPPVITTILLQLTLVAAAAFLWYAHPRALRRTIFGLLLLGGLIFVLTGMHAMVER